MHESEQDGVDQTLEMKISDRTSPKVVIVFEIDIYQEECQIRATVAIHNKCIHILFAAKKNLDFHF